MNIEQIIAIIALPILFLVMYFVFNTSKKYFGKKYWNGLNVAWHLGMFIYWSICILVPIILIGLTNITQLFEIKSIGIIFIAILLAPPIITFIGRFVIKYERTNVKGQVALGITSIIMGILEEILWRGVFIILFPDNLFWGFIWPTIWFAIWHLAPSSVSAIKNKWMLVLGALVFGSCWGFVAIQTGTIFWSILSHIGTGLVRIISKPKVNK